MTLICNRVRLLVVIASLGWLCSRQQTEAAAGLSDGVVCTDIEAVGETVCAISSYTTPSPAVIDGETMYLGGWSDFYQITNAENATTGLEITTTLSDEGVCDVMVKYPEAMEAQSCNSCNLCGSDKTSGYAANCTNLLYGRIVDCQSGSGSTSDIYFPLTAEALKEFAAPASAPAGDGQVTPGDDEDMPTEGGTGMNTTDSDVDIPMEGGVGMNATDGDADVPMEGGVGMNTTDGDVDMPTEGGANMNATDDGGEGGGINATEASPSPSPSPSPMPNEVAAMNATDANNMDMGGGMNATDGDVGMGNNDTDTDGDEGDMSGEGMTGGDDTDTGGPAEDGNGDSPGTGGDATPALDSSLTSGSDSIILGAYSSAMLALALSTWL